QRCVVSHVLTSSPTRRSSDLASLELFSRSFELLAFGGRRFDGERFHEWNDFSIAAAEDGHPPTRGLHVGFAATSRAQVDGWWERSEELTSELQSLAYIVCRLM